MRRSELESLHRALFGPLVCRLEFKHRLSTEDSRDIVQKAFLLALEKKMGAEGNAAAWFVRVVDNIAMRHRGTAARRAGLLERWGPPTGRATADEEDEQ